MMKSSVLFAVAMMIMYLGFFTTHAVGESHWSYYPTIIFSTLLVIIHLIGSWGALKSGEK